MENKDVHTEHCCKTHGCKYGDSNCTVETGKKAQSFPCEDCREESPHSEFLQTLKKSEFYIYTACTGAGAGLQNILWSEPGISSVFVGSEFPYKGPMTDAFLGFTPDKYVSEETAVNMAVESFIRAKTVAYKEGKWDQKCIGLGITASVATEKVHRGKHAVFMYSISDDGFGRAYTNLLKKEGRQARMADGARIDDWGIHEIKYQVKHSSCNIYKICPELDKAFWDRPVFTINRRLKESSNKIKFPGNFNPPHAGHFDMTKRSSNAMGGKNVDFLINTDNPHKPHVSIIECLCRVAMFRAAEDFATSANAIHFTKGQPLFVDKVRAFPTCRFIVGADTLQRMLDPKWGPSREEVLAQIPNRSLIAFVRHMGNETLGTFTACGDHSCYNKILQNMGASLNISSSQIREERKLTKIKQDDLWPVP